MSYKDKKDSMAELPQATISNNITVCAGQINAVSPLPAHPSPAGMSNGKLPAQTESRPGTPLPRCTDRSGYGPDCVGCTLEKECEEIERKIHEEFMAEMYPNGHDDCVI
jgi:hypothetical protein